MSAATAGAPLPFIIEAKDIAGNTTVSVYYTVNRNTGGVVENSAIAEFQVGSSGEDIANTVPVAVEATGNNGTLLQKSDYYRLDELTIKAPAYKGMAVNDTVKVYWIGRNYTYGSDIETVGVAGDITFTIPRMEFIDTIGGSANIYFTVQKHGTDEIINSASLWLQVQGQSLELPAPDVSDDLLVVTVIYPGMSSDDRVQVRVAGKNINDTDLKEGNGSNRLVFTIDKSWLERDTRGALLYNYAVGVNGGEYEFSRVTRIS